METPPPPLRTKLIFWLLLGFLSVAIAEVSVASAPLAFINPVETVFLTLFYGSHLLVFAWLIFRKGWPSLTALWLGGVLFGLYEFYITKVMFTPPWGDSIRMAHVDVLSIIVLALFWHPFMAFIYPLAIGETLGTRTRWVTGRLPEWFTGARRRTVIAALVLAALLHGMMTGDAGIALVSTASALIAVYLVAGWWRRNERSRHWDLRSLLPNDRQGKVVAAVLLLQYAIFVPLWNTDRLPPALGHIVALLLYAGFFLLLFDAVARTSSDSAVAAGSHPGWPRRRLIQWAGTLLTLSVLGSLGQPEVAALVVWIIGTVAGLTMLTVSLRKAAAPLRRDDPPAVATAEHIGGSG